VLADDRARDALAAARRRSPVPPRVVEAAVAPSTRVRAQRGLGVEHRLDEVLEVAGSLEDGDLLAQAEVPALPSNGEVLTVVTDMGASLAAKARTRRYFTTGRDLKLAMDNPNSRCWLTPVAARDPP